MTYNYFKNNYYNRNQNLTMGGVTESELLEEIPKKFDICRLAENTDFGILH